MTIRTPDPDRISYTRGVDALEDDNPDKMGFDARRERRKRHPNEQMARLYVRDDDGRRATEMVLCPDCGTAIPWPKGYNLPSCFHTSRQRRWRTSTSLVSSNMFTDDGPAGAL